MVMKPELESFDLIIENNLSPVIFSFHSLKALIKALEKHPKKLKSYLINIKLDTGMHRLGFYPNEVPELISQLKKHPNIKIESIFSHAASQFKPDKQNRPSISNAKVLVAEVAKVFKQVTGAWPPYSKGTWFPLFISEVGDIANCGDIGRDIVEAAIKGIKPPV